MNELTAGEATLAVIEERCGACLLEWNRETGLVCGVCGKRVCAKCAKRAFICPKCGVFECVVCGAKAKHLCLQKPTRKSNSVGKDLSVDPTVPVRYAEIRLLPMSHRKEFEDRDLMDIQREFFHGEIRLRNSWFRYRRHRMSDPTGTTLVLFQMKGRILGSAELLKVEPFKVPEIHDEIEYGGRYVFVPETIRMVHPIDLAEFRESVPEIKVFNQGFQRIPSQRHDSLLQLLTSKELKLD